MLTFAFLLGLLPLPLSARAGTVTWSADPATQGWNKAANWSPAMVPNSPNDTAVFDFSSKTTINISAGDLAYEVDGLAFNPGASVFTIAVIGEHSLSLSGAGVANNSSKTQTLSARTNEAGYDSYIKFTNSSTAGESMVYDIQGALICDGLGATLDFLDNTSASNDTFMVSGGQMLGAGGAHIHFYGTSTADNVTLICNNGGMHGYPGAIAFGFSGQLSNSSVVAYGGDKAFATSGIFNYGTAKPLTNVSVTTYGGTAANAFGGTAYLAISNAVGCTFTANGATAAQGGGGYMDFFSTFDTGNSTLIANGGTNGGNGGAFYLYETSVVGGRVEIFGNGTLDITNHEAPGAAVGSIEGDGVVNLAGLNLTVGSNSLSTVFSGTLQGSAGSSLTKVGSGTLTLSHANIYPAGTTVTDGGLSVTNSTGSGTGSGPLAVNAGTLSGSGIIAGAVTIGTGNGAGAIIAPAAGGPAPMTLTTQSALTFKADGTYICTLSTKRKQADQVSALGVAINSGAQFNLQALAKKRLTTGQTFVVLNNTASTPISGTFTNLANGATLKSGNNKFQASYSGGDGNDLTLTVIP